MMAFFKMDEAEGLVPRPDIGGFDSKPGPLPITRNEDRFLPADA
jgi:hypothetical protein